MFWLFAISFVYRKEKNKMKEVVNKGVEKQLTESCNIKTVVSFIFTVIWPRAGECIGSKFNQDQSKINVRLRQSEFTLAFQIFNAWCIHIKDQQQNSSKAMFLKSDYSFW